MVFTSAPPDMRYPGDVSRARRQAVPRLRGRGDVVRRAHATVRSLAAYLVEQGVQPGDRVAIAMRNYPEWALSYWATIYRCRRRRCQRLVDPRRARVRPKRLSSKVVICDGERLAISTRSSVAFVRVATCTSSPCAPTASCRQMVRWADVVDADSARRTPCRRDRSRRGHVHLLYLGHHRLPEGRPATHRGSVHNLMHMAFANAAAGAAAAAVAESGAVEIEPPKEVPPSAMVPTPLFHVTANNCVLHPLTFLGAKLVLMHKWIRVGPRADRREQVATFTGVPTRAVSCSFTPTGRPATSSLGSMGGGGAACTTSSRRSVRPRGRCSPRPATASRRPTASSPPSATSSSTSSRPRPAVSCRPSTTRWSTRTATRARR